MLRTLNQRRLKGLKIHEFAAILRQIKSVKHLGYVATFHKKKFTDVLYVTSEMKLLKDDLLTAFPLSIECKDPQIK
jgi:hypothetical protein